MLLSLLAVRYIIYIHYYTIRRWISIHLVPFVGGGIILLIMPYFTRCRYVIQGSAYGCVGIIRKNIPDIFTTDLIFRLEHELKHALICKDELHLLIQCIQCIGYIFEHLY